MIEKRTARLIVNKSGGTSTANTFRATLPTNWIRQMGLNEDLREIEILFDDAKEEITIKKCPQSN